MRRYGHWITFFLGKSVFAGVINWGLRGELDFTRGVASSRVFVPNFSDAASTFGTLLLAAGAAVDSDSAPGNRTARECELRLEMGAGLKSSVATRVTGGATNGEGASAGGSTGATTCSRLGLSFCTLAAETGGGTGRSAFISL